MITFEPYALPLRTKYRWAKGVQRERRGLIARVEVGDNVGWGEAAPSPHKPVDGDALRAEAEALVAGLDADDPGFLQQIDERSPAPRLRCAVSTAWLSARAAGQGVSLGRLLAGGASQPATEVPVNGLITEAEAGAAADRARDLVSQGMRTLKIKCGPDRGSNVERVRAVRNAVPSARLRLDANESWDRAWALSHLEELASFDIDYVEQPFPHETDLESFAALRAESPVPIALDESVLSLDAARNILDAEAADTLILKAQRLGGPDRTVAIARMSETRGVQCTVTASLESAVGLTMALHCASLLPPPIPPSGIGTARFLERDLARPPEIADGWMHVPESAGLGVSPSMPTKAMDRG
jgi:o-succinylbenzoate synthase